MPAPASIPSQALNGPASSSWANLVKSWIDWLAAGISFDPWTTWTPVWTASGTNPTLGSGGSITGSYVQIGKTVHFSMTLTLGSGASGGSGSWQFTLPVPPKAGVVPTGTGYVTFTAKPLVWRLSSTVMILIDTTSGTALSSSSGISSGTVNLNGTYEAA